MEEMKSCLSLPGASLHRAGFRPAYLALTLPRGGCNFVSHAGEEKIDGKPDKGECR